MSSPSHSKQQNSAVKYTSDSLSDSPSKRAQKSPTSMVITTSPPSSPSKTKADLNRSHQSRTSSDTKSCDENEAEAEEMKAKTPTKNKANKHLAGEEEEAERGSDDVVFCLKEEVGWGFKFDIRKNWKTDFWTFFGSVS